MAGTDDHEYPDDFVTALQWMWGEGFLSPGGADEVVAILDGVDLSGSTVLDIGCGLGAIDVLLATTHGAGHVTGIDIEAPLVERSRETAARAGVSDRVSIELVEPGPLPFADASFDAVFTKDSLIHVADKPALYAEVLRVLRPGGVFVGSDWLRGGEGEYSAQMQAWLDIVHLTFRMENMDQLRVSLETAGFEQVSLRDRNAWYLGQVERELESFEGERFRQLADLVGEEAASHRRRSSTVKREVVECGELRPTHFRGRKGSL